MTDPVTLFKLSVYAVIVAHLLHELTHYSIAWVLGTRPAFGINGLRQTGWLGYVGSIEITHNDGGALFNYVIHVAPFALGLMFALTWIKFIGGAEQIEVWMVVGWFVYTLLGLPNDMRFMEVGEESTV